MEIFIRILYGIYITYDKEYVIQKYIRIIEAYGISVILS